MKRNCGAISPHWEKKQQLLLWAIAPWIASMGLHFGQGRKNGQEILGKPCDPISLPLGKGMQVQSFFSSNFWCRLGKGTRSIGLGRTWAKEESRASISRPLWRQLRNQSRVWKSWTLSVFYISHLIKENSAIACAILNILLTKVKTDIACQLCFSNLPLLSCAPSVFKL